MIIVPVIDLSQGLAVLAFRGQRNEYRPIQSPLCDRGEVLPLVQRLADAFPFTDLYLADLDAIRQRGNQAAIIDEIASRHPTLTLWIDAGFDAPGAMQTWIARAGIRPVIGTETWRHSILPQGPDFLLSLDRDADGLRDPAGIANRPSHFPRDLVLMDLARIGSTLGPDLDRLRDTGAQTRPGTRLFLAGGARDLGDLLAIRDAGAAGVLLASALHRGSLGADELKIFS